jgi:hypothetical protein
MMKMKNPFFSLATFWEHKRKRDIHQQKDTPSFKFYSCSPAVTLFFVLEAVQGSTPVEVAVGWGRLSDGDSKYRVSSAANLSNE